MVLGKLASHVQKAETGPLPNILHKKQLKLIEDLNVKCKTIKTLKDNLKKYPFGHRTWQILHDEDANSNCNKNEN